MSDLWTAPSEVMELIQYHISHNHPHLALVDKEIAAVFREKAGKRGGQVVLGVAKKAPPLMKVLGKSEYKFVLEIAADEWATLDNDQKSALVDHLLCYCKVEEDEESGEMKFSLGAPEVSFFWDELKRHGDWRPRPQQESGPTDLNVETVLKPPPDASDKASA